MAGENKRLMHSVHTEEPLGLGPLQKLAEKGSRKTISKQMNKELLTGYAMIFSSS